MKKAMKCMAGILALTLAFAQVAPVSAFAEETTATTATEEAQAVYSGDCSAEGSSVTWTYNPTEKTLTFSGTNVRVFSVGLYVHVTEEPSALQSPE